MEVSDMAFRADAKFCQRVEDCAGVTEIFVEVEYEIVRLRRGEG